jgi:nucleotide-binding universal stress UspA family protein
MIVIAYDGSADSKAAIDQAAKQYPGASAVVVSVWQHFADTIARAGFAAGLGSTGVDYEQVDEESEKIAGQRAEEGAEQARAAGLDAQPATTAVGTTIADAILAEADRVDATAIVMGSRGLTGVKSLLLGSVSNAVVHHADRPVVVVPSPEVAKHRLEHRTELASS